MNDFQLVAPVTAVSVGMIKTFRVGAKVIAVANVDGEFFAIDDQCSHEECSLGTDGAMDGNVVICGCHGSQFDVTDGKVLSLPAPTDIQTYEIKVENGEILIKF